MTDHLVEAVRIVRDGGVALVPTETVVGLVAGERGFHRLAQLKARDPSKPIALLCGSAQQAFEFSRAVPALARTLAERYWPGPLTLVLDGRDGGTVGVRVPDHPTIQALLAACGEPLYGTSANISGEPAPGAVDGVDPLILGAVDVVLNGVAGTGEASAVVDLSGGQVRLLRSSAALNMRVLRQLAGESVDHA